MRFTTSCRLPMQGVTVDGERERKKKQTMSSAGVEFQQQLQQQPLGGADGHGRPSFHPSILASILGVGHKMSRLLLLRCSLLPSPLSSSQPCLSSLSLARSLSPAAVLNHLWSGSAGERALFTLSLSSPSFCSLSLSLPLAPPRSRCELAIAPCRARPLPLTERKER